MPYIPKNKKIVDEEQVIKDLQINIKSFNDNSNYHEVFLIRSANQDNIKLLKDIIYDVPYGMNRKYNRLHQNLYERRSETII